jgi:hypothetical protein
MNFNSFNTAKIIDADQYPFKHLKKDKNSSVTEVRYHITQTLHLAWYATGQKQ